MGTTTGDTPGRNLLTFQEGNAWATTTSSIPAGTYHLAMVLSTTSATARAFVNGQMASGQLTITGTLDAARGLAIGGKPGGTRLMTGTPRVSNVSVTQYPFLTSSASESMPTISAICREHYNATRR